MMDWLRWAFWRRKQKLCGAWDPVEGFGRDTHICVIIRDHKGTHRCYCTAEWGNTNDYNS